MRKIIVAALLAVGCAATQDAGDGFVPLFNGRDLSGWVRVNCGPDTFTVRDGTIVCSGKPTGVMRTERQYENYVLELEWRHAKEGGNAGLFVHSGALPVCGVPFTRSIEVQIMLGDAQDGSYTRHGDVFAIHGATFEPDRPHPKGWMRCLPSEKRVKGAGEWNHYRVECRDGRITLAVNGAVVSGGSSCDPQRGYICLESEGSEVRFRNLRIRGEPLPADDDAFAPLDFKMDDHWRARDWLIDYDGKGKDLWTEKEYGNFQLVADWRLPRKPADTQRPVIKPDGSQEGTAVVPDAGDSGIYLRGSSKSQVNIWCWPVGSGEVYGYRTDANMSPGVRAGVTPKSREDRPPGQWNRFVITMTDDRLTVMLNGKFVIENAQLPGVAPRGRIALQSHGDPVQFANLYIRELP